jgi:hypothetical protein
VRFLLLLLLLLPTPPKRGLSKSTSGLALKNAVNTMLYSGRVGNRRPYNDPTFCNALIVIP